MPEEGWEILLKEWEKNQAAIIGVFCSQNKVLSSSRSLAQNNLMTDPGMNILIVLVDRSLFSSRNSRRWQVRREDNCFSSI